MQRILRLMLLLVALFAATVGIVACGGDSAGSDTSVDELLEDTFSGDKKVDSGQLSVSVKLNVTGGSESLEGPVDIRLSGPFQSQGKGKLPKFDLDATLEGAGQSIRAGATSTGDKGFVNFNGNEYAVDAELFKQFKDSFEKAAAESEKDNSDQSFQSLGVDPRKWLKDARNAGEAQVGDEEDVIKITGGVDVPKLLDDVDVALKKASELGASAAGGAVPSGLTADQRKQIQEAVQNVGVEIYTGAEDRILRRLFVNLDLKDPEGKNGTAKVSLDIAITELNKGQDIAAPEGVKPFDELLGQLGGLGLGGGSGSSSGSSGSSAGGSASSSASPDPAALQKFSDCVEAAGEDRAKAQECADLIAP